MRRAPSRRDFLRISLGAAAALPVSTAAVDALRSQDGETRGHIRSASLTDTLLHVEGAGGNVVALRGPDGLLMVNGGSAEHSADLLQFLNQRFDGLPVGTLFNTDWHPEHTGSNLTLGRRGTPIVAHEHTKQYLGADIFVDWQKRTYRALPAPALPSKTFHTSGSVTFGGERIEYGHLGQAHTDADIYVFFRGANVLVAGDVLAAGAYPIADYTTGGWLGGLASATKTLLDLADSGTRVVAGTGPLQTRADLQAQHEMLMAVRDRLTKMMRQGMGAADMLAAGATKEFDAKWGDPSLFLSTTYRGLWLHVRELGGIV